MHNPDANKQHFIELIEEGRYDHALQVAQQYSETQPYNPTAYAMLGDALKQQGEFDKATVFYRYALEIDPAMLEVQLALGEAYTLQGEPGKAYVCYTKALEMAPQDALVLQKVGQFLVAAGNLEEAREVLEQSLSHGNTQAIHGLLDLNLYLGDRRQLMQFVEQYKTLIEQHDGDLGLARVAYSLGEFERVLELLKPLSMQGKNKVWLAGYYHLMASAEEKLGLKAQAFSHYQQQNACSAEHYDAAAVERLVDEIMHLSSRLKPLTEKPGREHKVYSPLFIVGLPRSGTSLVEQVLNTSSHVVPGGELLFVEAAYKQHVEAAKTLREVALWYREKIEFITRCFRMPKTAPRWVTDKLPANFLFIGFIRALLPDARFVYCQRDPMDNGFSIFKQNLLTSHRYANRLEDIAHYVALERRVMKKWLAEYPQQIHTLHYESLVSDFNRETSALFSFAELDWHPGVHDFYKNRKFCNTASWEQVAKPLYSSAVKSSSAYQQQLEPLQRALAHYQISE